MGVKNDPTCRGCHDDEETAVHILCECEADSAYRFEHIGRHLLEPWEMHDIPVCCLLNFVSATGLFQVLVWGQYNRPLELPIYNSFIHSNKSDA